MITSLKSQGGSVRGARRGLAAAALLTPFIALAGTAHADEPTSEITIESSSVSPSVVVGGDSAIQTIKLTAPAPPGGLDIGLYVDGDSVYGPSVDHHAFVPAGQTSVSFPVRFEPPAQEKVLHLRAQVPDEVDNDPRQRFIADVTLVPADPTQRRVSAMDVIHNNREVESVLDGETVTGRVSLLNPAPAGGLTVGLKDVPNTFYTVVQQGKTATDVPFKVTATQPRILKPKAHLGTSVGPSQIVVVPRRFALPQRTFAQPGVTFEMPVGIGTTLAPLGSTIDVASDTPGVRVLPTLRLGPWEPGGHFTVAVDGDVPVGTKATITAKWFFQTVTTTVEIF